MDNRESDTNKIKTDNNRKRLLLILKYLYRNTDRGEGDQASVYDLIKICEQEGINGNRNTIRDDINALIDSDFGITSIPGSNNAKLYYYDRRLFDLDELKVLADSIRESMTIDDEQKLQLLDKLLMLCSVQEAQEIKGIITE